MIIQKHDICSMNKTQCLLVFIEQETNLDSMKKLRNCHCMQ